MRLIIAFRLNLISPKTSALMPKSNAIINETTTPTSIEEACSDDVSNNHTAKNTKNEIKNRLIIIVIVLI